MEGFAQDHSLYPTTYQPKRHRMTKISQALWVHDCGLLSLILILELHMSRSGVERKWRAIAQP